MVDADSAPALSDIEMKTLAGKPSNWWAREREPWKRIGAEIAAREKADAGGDRADRALRSAFAFAGAALGIATAAPPPADEGLNLGE